MTTHRLLLFSCGNLNILNATKSEIFDDIEISTLKTVCIPTAANIYAEKDKSWLYEEIKIFSDFGLNVDLFDIQNKSNAEIKDALSDADIIYMTGGNTYFLLDQINKTNLKHVIQERLNNGSLYIGCSAGAVISCPDISHIEDMDDMDYKGSQLPVGERNLRGMNLCNVSVLPHIDHPKYGKIAKKIMNNYRDDVNMIGIKDNQALYIKNKIITILND